MGRGRERRKPAASVSPGVFPNPSSTCSWLCHLSPTQTSWAPKPASPSFPTATLSQPLPHSSPPLQWRPACRVLDPLRAGPGPSRTQAWPGPAKSTSSCPHPLRRKPELQPGIQGLPVGHPWRRPPFHILPTNISHNLLCSLSSPGPSSCLGSGVPSLSSSRLTHCCGLTSHSTARRPAARPQAG